MKARCGLHATEFDRAQQPHHLQPTKDLWSSNGGSVRPNPVSTKPWEVHTAPFVSLIHPFPSTYRPGKTTIDSLGITRVSPDFSSKLSAIPLRSTISS